MSVSVKRYVRRRERKKTIKDRFGHIVKVGEWPSQKGMARLRRHYKREHPRAFRKSIEKGVQTRKMRAHDWPCTCPLHRGKGIK